MSESSGSGANKNGLLNGVKGVGGQESSRASITLDTIRRVFTTVNSLVQMTVFSLLAAAASGYRLHSRTDLLRRAGNEQKKKFSPSDVEIGRMLPRRRNPSP